NFEHILAATPHLAEWLSTSVRLQLLVTSRSALHIRGERLFPVSPLPVPPAPGSSAGTSEPLALSRLAEVAGYPSVALFVERVQAADPGFHLTESNSRI